MRYRIPNARRRFAGSAGVLVGSLLAVLLLSIPATGASARVPIGQAVVTCNPKNASPSALDIPGSAPARIGAGAKLNVTVQFLVANYSKADRGVSVYFPSITAVFPKLPSGSVSVFFPPKTIGITSSKWSANRTVGTTVGTATRIDPNATAYLSTSKIAVMAGMPTGTLTIEVRWHWAVFNPSTGAHSSGAWTKPSYAASGPFLPSIFFPASYVGIVSTSGSRVPTNSTYVIGLNGSVQSTWFRMVLEYPANGTEIQSIFENTTANNTVFNATLPIAFRNGTGIPAGNYLMHVHDSCEAIVHVLQVSVY